MDSKELMSKARTLVAQMIDIVDANETGFAVIAGEQIPIDNQVKHNLKLSYNAKRADLIKALNDVVLK